MCGLVLWTCPSCPAKLDRFLPYPRKTRIRKKMHKLKLDLKPKLMPLEIVSYKGVSGSFPFQGTVGGFAGRRPQRMFRGKGLEFEKFREFTPGDDASAIDWKATLRAHKTLVKVYTAEQNKDIILLLDVSSSMVYSSIGKLKCEYAAELVSSLAYSVVDTGDNVGFAMFTDRIIKYFTPTSGRRQYHLFMETIKNPKYYEGKFDFSNALQELAKITYKNAMIILVSDFIGLKPGWEKVCMALNKKFEFICFCIRDPADDAMPEQEENVVVADPFSGNELIIAPKKLADEYRKYNKRILSSIENVFIRNQNRFLVLHTDEDFKSKIERFFLEQTTM